MTPARLAREMAHIEAMNDKLQQEKFIEFKSACDNGEPGGCNGLGEWYAVLNTRYEEGASIFYENCKSRKHSTSCFHLGILHSSGRVKGASPVKAAEYFDDSCEWGNKDGCFAAAKAGFQAPEEQRKPEKILAQLRKACALENYKACSSLGGLLLVGSKGIPRSPADAIPPLVASCEAGEVLSCKNLSVLYKGADVIPADPDKVKYYRSRLADHIEAQTGKKLDRD